MSDTSVHVCIVRGDLLRFAGDDIVVPTDRSGRIEQPWVAHLEKLKLHGSRPSSTGRYRT